MNNLSDEEIKDIWHNTPTQGDPSGMKFAIAFARVVASLSAPHQGTEHPVGSALTDEQIADIAESMGASDPHDSFWREFASAVLATPKAAPAAVQDGLGMPPSYRGGTLTSDAEGGAKITFHFSDMAEADAWHEAILTTSPAPAAVSEPSEVAQALHFVDDIIARYNGDDRGSCEAVEILRRAIAATQPQSKPDLWIGTGHLREVLNGNAMNVYVSAERDRFADVPLYTAAAPAPASQGAPKQHFCEKPVAWTDNQMIAFAGFSMYSVSLQHLSIAERLEHFRSCPSDGAQATVVGKPTPQEDK